MSSTTAQAPEETVAPPRRLRDYVVGLGPGIVVSMAWLGAGDLVDSSVSGGNYGYALMWSLALALFCRFFFVNAIAKYGLCNASGDPSLMAGFRRLWSKLPLVIGVAAFVNGFILQTYMSVGVGTALFHLTGEIGGNEDWGVFAWTAIAVVATALLVGGGKRYRWLEIVARVAVAVLVVSFVGAAIVSRPAPVEVVRGLAFETPANEGLFSTVLVAAAVIGAVGGSAANLMYPEFMRDKGWKGPGFLRLQQVDLLVGIVAIIVVDLAVWVVAAQTVRANHLTIDGVNDLARMMQLAVGGLGPTLLWLGLFFVTFSSFPAYATGFTKILFAGVYESVPRRRERYGEGERDPLFNWLQVGVMVVVPLVFALPAFPDALTLTVAGSSIGVLLAPFIMGGTIVLTTAKRFMQPGYANRWWETVILLGVFGVGVWASYGVVRGLVELALKMM